MNDIRALTEIDFSTVFLGVFTALAGLKSCTALLEWVQDKLGLETKWTRQKREDHNMILANTQAIKDLTKLHEQDNKISNEHDEKIREDLSVFMTEVRSDIKSFTENRIHDREQSREIQKELNEAQMIISKNVQAISEKIDNMQQKTNERFALSEEKINKQVQSDIKERIAQSYRHYNQSQKITHMELEALEDLIDTYESFGGTNSFIHSIVQKEMYTWEVTE